MKEEVPEGSRVIVSWTKGKAEEWYGHVVREHKSNFKAARADMCIALSRVFGAGPTSTFKKIKDLPDNLLHEAYTRVIYSSDPANRELLALQQFTQEKPANPALAVLQQAFISNPIQQHIAIDDITLGIPRTEEHKKNYQQRYASIHASNMCNEEQLELLAAPFNIHNRIVIEQGNPGTGKTSTGSLGILLLADVGHKVLVCAPTNGAVDAMARRVWANAQGDLGSNKKMLRLEISSVEDGSILRTDQEFSAGVNVHKAGSEKAESTWQDYPGYQHALSKTLNELEVNELAYEEFKNQESEFQDVYERVHRRFRGKEVNVALAMTLSYRIWNLMLEDQKVAREKYIAQARK